MGRKEEDNLIQENIQEFVYDDNKIVTCKWLSLTLSIPVNSAKQALFEFVDQTRNEGNNDDDVNVSYFVSGFDTKESGTKILKCIVVPESHLDSVKKTLDPLTSCHVYSVQKAQLKDYTPLYQADYDICKENIQALSKFSSISCPWAVKRDGQAGGTHGGNGTTPKSVDKGSSESKSTPSSNVTSSSTSSKTNGSKKADSKKGGIASMFAAAEKKKSETTVAKDVSSKSTVAKDVSSKSTAAKKAKESTEKKGMESFLKGQAAGSKVKKETSPNLKVDDSKTNQTTSKSKSRDSKADKSQKHKLPVKDEPERKRRRRIRNDLFDSSDEEDNKSDDDVNIEESEDEESKPVAGSDPEDEDADAKKDTEICEEEDEQEPEKEKEKSPEKEGGRNTDKDESARGKKRKRTRKLVPRQHIDEDGFMVTEKVWESDSTDATDDEQTSKPTKAASPVKTNAPKPVPQNKKKQAVSPSKNKQTSLMSFFKKK